MKVKEILEMVENHEISVDEAAILIDNPIDYATIDYNRKRRTGTPEIIYGSGKTKEQIAGIIKNMFGHDQIDILATRVDATNEVNGNSVILLARVCKTTAKAPISNPTTTPKILASNTLEEVIFFFNSGLTING